MSPAPATRPRIDAAQRRARLARRHLLAPEHRAATAEETADAVVALHASDPATVHLAACARLRAPDRTEVERALYDDRSLVRMLCMRRTLFALGTELAPVIASAAARPIAARERRGLVKWVRDGLDWDDARRNPWR
ncbi:DNA glycosylase AlkZ-like family protein [Streptomyces noursei]